MKNDIINFLEASNYQFEEVLKVFPELGGLKGVEQNPEWHGEGDVFIHTQLVCEQILSFAEWGQLDRSQKGLLFLAACFHDIGKKICTKTENDIIISPYHAVKGAKLFRELWYCEYSAQFELTFWMREQVSNLIRYHGLPLLFMEKHQIDYHLIEARESTDFLLLYLLAKADILGRYCTDIETKIMAVEYFKEYTNELGIYKREKAFHNLYTKRQYFKKKDIWHGECRYDDSAFSVYLMSGLPLSGKDTYIQEYLSQWPMVSLDQIRAEMKISPSAGSGLVVNEAKERAKVFLREKQTFVWNATNIIMDTRQKVCTLFEKYGARVTIIYIEVPYEELLRRNEIRKRDIPANVLHHMIKKMEIPKRTEAYEVRYEVD